MAGHSEQDIDDIFGSHKMDDKTFEQFQEIKAKFKDLAQWVKQNVPGCPLQTTAINKLFEAKNAATVGFLMHEVQKIRKEAS